MNTREFVKVRGQRLCAATLAACLATSALWGCAPAQQQATPDASSTQQASADEGQVQYTLYLGTNDKDTNQPVFSPEESKEKAKEILVRYFGGYTIQEAEGGWVGDDGTLYQEHTLVILLNDTTKDKVHAACDELIKTFNQSSVLINENVSKAEFYEGTK